MVTFGNILYYPKPLPTDDTSTEITFPLSTWLPHHSSPITRCNYYGANKTLQCDYYNLHVHQ